MEELQDIAFKEARYTQLSNALVHKLNITDSLTHAQHSGVGELYRHFNAQVFDRDVAAAFALLSHMEVRKIIEQSVILGLSDASILDALSYELGLLVPLRTLQIYCKYFCNRDMDKLQWFTFLNKHDVFGYKSLLCDGDLNKATTAIFTQQDSSKHEFSFVAKKSFSQLVENLDSAAPDPDVCTKWFKLLAAARLKSPVDPLAGAGKESSTLDMGLTPAPEFPVLSIDDLVSGKDDVDTPKDPSK